MNDDEQRITGMMMYYYFVCKRKLWYFCKQLTMEQYNENVKIGKIIKIIMKSINRKEE